MNLGFLNPAGAVALVAVGVLVALHLHGRRQRVVPVATLFLWQQVPPRRVEPRRFLPDLLFLARLALLLALIGGYLRPYLEDVAPTGERVHLLIVLDTSASMQAREAGGTRFELARRRARALVAQLLTGDEVMLVAAGERAHLVLGWTAEHARAQGRLEALEPLDTPTNLAPALELALVEVRARPATRVVVLTDLPREDSGIDPARLSAVDWVAIGRSDDNVAIAGLDVEEQPFRPAREASVTVLVRNYGRAARRVTLTATVADTPWTRRELLLPARGAEQVLLTGPPGAGELSASLDVDDALAVDDRAVGYIAGAPALDLLVVTGSRDVAATFERVASTLTGSRVEVLDPADWSPERAASARAIVFDGSVPARPPPVPALYVEPPAGNTVCPAADRPAEDVAVIDWEADHPALRGLEGLHAILLPEARRLETPPDGAALVLAATREGAFPLLVAGERDGRWIACLGARPRATSDGLPLVVLTLGTLRWLEERPDTVPLAVRTGVPVLAPRGVGDAREEGLRAIGDPPVLVAERVGLHHLGGTVVAANLFDDRESDIGRASEGEWPATTSLAAPLAGRPHEVGWWLYLLGAALLGLEWLLWRRRATEAV